ncbi:tRNA lysidine(34) synthetase TilS [Paenibacillus sp. GSMTC-2017]|uniref:tRNA lysidine(34) synthetase TilS n=1 Tax=Paenibacillus sp. GSMTC-2017 TaxID=2794350 RepID=UPI001E3E7F2A|nr:tRNA lysidine(34) synthetase TilS [Paenibacillus sp. GSMTC-2017]
MNDSLHIELMKEAADRGLWSTGDTIVVAVSGGADSMALLHMLYSLAEQQKLSLIVGHVNHGFRGAESQHELDVVVAYAEQLGLRVETDTLDLPTYIEENRLNLQAAAREKRYEFLHDVAKRNGASTIALAHHADDQAETVLMRLIRGTGLTGLAGMGSKRSEKNMELIRPLLRKNKLDLLRYCEEYEIPYCTDSSNQERYYFRNTIRLDILPYLSQYNPQLSLSLQRLAEVAGAEDDWMEQQGLELFEKLVRRKPNECAISCTELGRIHVALQRRLIKLILSYLSHETENLSYGGVETMRLAASTNAPATWKMDAGGRIQCLREYDVMRWVRISQYDEGLISDRYGYKIHKGMEQLHVAPCGWNFNLEWLEPGQYRKPTSRFEASFDSTMLTFPLQIRNRKPGDRIQVLGLNGSKKVQDMFVDEKIAPSGRELYPLLFDSEDRLLWIPGIRRSSHALTGDSTKGVLFISASNE